MAITDPTDISDLEFWVDASIPGSITESGGVVTQWDDQSTAGRDVAQATGGLQPTTSTVNNEDSILFDANDRLTATISSIDCAEITVAMVITPTTELSGDTPMQIQLGNGGRFFYLQNGTDLDATWDFIGTDDVSITNTDVVADGATSWHIARNRPSTDGDTDFLSIDGTEGTDSGSAVTSAPTDTIAIGGKANGANAWTGHVHEIVIYSRHITDTERQDLADYFDEKWLPLTASTSIDTTSAITAVSELVTLESTASIDTTSELTATTETTQEATAAIATASAMSATTAAIREATATIAATSGLSAASEALLASTAIISATSAITAIAPSDITSNASIDTTSAITAITEAIQESTVAIATASAIAATTDVQAPLQSTSVIATDSQLSATTETIQESTAVITTTSAITSTSEGGGAADVAPIDVSGPPPSKPGRRKPKRLSKGQIRQREKERALRLQLEIEEDDADVLDAVRAVIAALEMEGIL